MSPYAPKASLSPQSPHSHKSHQPKLSSKTKPNTAIGPTGKVFEVIDAEEAAWVRQDGLTVSELIEKGLGSIRLLGLWALCHSDMSVPVLKETLSGMVKNFDWVMASDEMCEEVTSVLIDVVGTSGQGAQYLLEQLITQLRFNVSQQSGVTIGDEEFASKIELKKRVRALLQQQPMGTALAPRDEKLMISLLRYHPRGDEVLTGVVSVKVDNHLQFEGRRAFAVVRKTDKNEGSGNEGGEDGAESSEADERCVDEESVEGDENGEGEERCEKGREGVEKRRERAETGERDTPRTNSTTENAEGSESEVTGMSAGASEDRLSELSAAPCKDKTSEVEQTDSLKELKLSQSGKEGDPHIGNDKDEFESSDEEEEVNFSYVKCIDNICGKEHLADRRLAQCVFTLVHSRPLLLQPMIACLKRSLPPNRADAWTITRYIRQILYLGDRIGEARRALLRMVFSKLTEIDVEIKQRDPNTFDDDLLHAWRSEQQAALLREVKIGNVDTTQTADAVKALNDPDTLKQLYLQIRGEEDIDPLAHKLDGIMDLVFVYVTRQLLFNEVEASVMVKKVKDKGDDIHLLSSSEKGGSSSAFTDTSTSLSEIDTTGEMTTTDDDAPKRRLTPSAKPPNSPHSPRSPQSPGFPGSPHSPRSPRSPRNRSMKASDVMAGELINLFNDVILNYASHTSYVQVSQLSEV
eukprot:GHVN01026898.1.p1 GENE.GHVN01026898.1~~GHVN01026898.1.p1  ORF type:complete len:717 (+),score=209.31 GHVN01026898.1:78-2153(+)